MTEIQEPTETFSVVKARDKQRPDSGLFWVRVNDGWMDDKEGRFRAWFLLDVLEVLRVGIGAAPSRFCSLRSDCRMADGHKGGCQP